MTNLKLVLTLTNHVSAVGLDRSPSLGSPHSHWLRKLPSLAHFVFLALKVLLNTTSIYQRLSVARSSDIFRGPVARFRIGFQMTMMTSDIESTEIQFLTPCLNVTRLVAVCPLNSSMWNATINLLCCLVFTSSYNLKIVRYKFMTYLLSDVWPVAKSLKNTINRQENSI